MNKYAFDIEVYPNFFSVIFVNLKEEFDTHIFKICSLHDDRQKVIDFINRDITLIGYNNLRYDNLILNTLSNGFNNFQLYELSKEIIESEKPTPRVISLMYQKTRYKSIDLMSIMAFDVKKISLKRVGIKLKWPKIQDLPVDPNKELSNGEMDEIVSYNFNDVLITKALYWAIESEVDSRADVSEFFGVDVSSASRSKSGNVIIEKLYCEETGQRRNQFINKRTFRPELRAADCIGKNIEFQSEEFLEFLSNLKSLKLTFEKKYKYKRSVRFKKKTYSIGVGGLHSKDSSRIYKSTSDYSIIDADVSSFYPNIILTNNLKPKHLSSVFCDIFQDITSERLIAKKEGNKIKSSAMKITINAIFGKLKYDKFWLYDPLAFLTVTISGQLYLLMLIEMLELAGIEVISANTDGIIALVKDKEKYNWVCKDWMNKTESELEFSEYTRYFRRDVNSYIVEKPNGHIKKKGVFVSDDFLEGDDVDLLAKGYKCPIVAKTLKSYFIDGIEDIDMLLNRGDIYDYLISEKTSKKFDILFDGEKLKQRVNRFYVAMEGGELVKSNGDQRISLCADEKVVILNDVEDPSLEKYDVNFGYYKYEVEKIIRAIEPSSENMSLF